MLEYTFVKSSHKLRVSSCEIREELLPVEKWPARIPLVEELKLALEDGWWFIRDSDMVHSVK